MLVRGVGTTMAGRNLALLNVAIHDATVSALDSKEAYMRARPSSLDPSLITALPVPSTSSYPSDDAAVAAAASDVLAYLFPDKADFFRQLAREAARSKLNAGLSFSSDVEAGLALGHDVGARVIARGKADGSDVKWTGAIPTGQGMWSGTDPASVTVGTWKTWVLPSADALRPPPPPAYVPAWHPRVLAAGWGCEHEPTGAKPVRASRSQQCGGYFRRDRSAPSKRSSRRCFFRGSPQGTANGSSGTPAPARVSRKRIGMVHRGSAGPTLRTRDGHQSARNPARDTAELAEFPSKGKDRAYLDQRGSSHFRAD